MAHKRSRATRDDEEEDAAGSRDATGKKHSARVPKGERIINLISFLLAQREPVPISAIIGTVAGYDDGATRDSLLRRFERDKQVLRDNGVPVEYEAPSAYGVEGYRIPKETYYLGEVELPANGARLLGAIFQAASRGSSGDLSDDLRSALIKLGFEAGEDPAEVLMQADSGEHLDLKLGSSPQIGRNLETLAEAVLRRKRISMKYYTIHRDEVIAREVDPYGLGYAGQAWNKGAWYLVGFCHLRQAPRVFKVDRIRGSVKIAKDKGGRGGGGDGLPRTDTPDFERAPGFNVRDHLNKARWEIRELAASVGSEAVKGEDVLVRFPAAIASAVRELVPSAEVAPEPGSPAPASASGQTVLRFHVQERRAFCRFLLPYVGQLEVLSPAEVGDALRELARDVLARYKAGAT
jgi:proteasome accessory factor B